MPKPLLPPATRHILQTIKQTSNIYRIHGLPAVAAPSFFPSASRNDETWWAQRTKETVYAWDSMDDQDRQNTMERERECDIYVYIYIYIERERERIRQHTSAYVSIRQHTSAYVSISQPRHERVGSKAV